MTGVYLTVESAGEPPQYTLTCISTGRSVSSFIWETYDPIDNSWDLVTNERKHKVLNDPMTAQYTITVTLTELMLDIFYVCGEYPDYYNYIRIEGKSNLITIAIISTLHAHKNCSFCSFTLMYRFSIL